MATRDRARRLAPLLLVSALLMTPSLGEAQDAKPEPTSCAGETFKDPAGDQVIQAAVPAPENLDLLRGFFRYAPVNGVNVLTANLEVTNLNKTLPPGSTGSAWYMRWNLGDVLQFASVTVGEDGKPVYEYGIVAGTSITPEGTTTGRFLEGKNGMVEIVIPVDKMKLEGKKLTATYGQGRYVTADALVSTADRGPNTGNGKDFTVTPCAEAGTATPVQDDPGTPTPPTTNPGGGDTGGQQSPPQQTQQPAPPPPFAAPVEEPARPKLDLRVIPGKLLARKIKRARRFSIRLRAGERLTGLKVVARRGSRVQGRGRLAAIDPGNGRITVKLSRKAAKRFQKGSLTLRFTARKADGTTAAGSVAVRVR